MRAIRKYHPLRAAKREHGELAVAFTVTGHTSVKRLHKMVGAMSKPAIATLLAQIRAVPNDHWGAANRKLQGSLK